MIGLRKKSPPRPAAPARAAPRRIVFTGDFLRPSVARLRPTQHENIQWLAKLLRTPIGMATGLPCEIVHWDAHWLNQSTLDTGTVEAIYRMMGLTPGIEAWPQVFGAAALPGPVEDRLRHWFADSFVIGFELPPFLTAFLGRHDIGFIDCSLAPVRFMDDLLFEMSADSAAVTQALQAHAVPQDYIRLAAGVLSSNVAKMNPAPPRPGTLLVILQTRFDKVVIENGRFATVLDHLDRLKEVARGYDHMLIKQHPLEPQPEAVAQLKRIMPGATETGDNFYRLVSHDNLRGVAALSSSCVAEAGYFGKTGHYLLPDYAPERFTVGRQGVYVDDAMICPDFWRDVLAASPCPVTPKDGLRLPPKPNRFRQQLRSAWGYNQIDTDIFVDWAPGKVRVKADP